MISSTGVLFHSSAVVGTMTSEGVASPPHCYSIMGATTCLPLQVVFVPAGAVCYI